jgi:putative ABC transport system ATP-binding protein
LLVEARALTKVYPMGIRALHSVSLSIRQGEFLGIMGRSGSGKSTLLQILGCLDRPTSGSLRFAGEEITTLPERALPGLRGGKLGFIFQAHNLIPSLTAWENTALPLRYRRPRLAVAAAKAQARQALEAVGMEDRLVHLPTQLSGGEQQRVAIARALVSDPLLVLADEPTGALDSQTARELLRLLRRLSAERGKTFVVVTHDPLVGQVCDRILTMADGRIRGG